MSAEMAVWLCNCLCISHVLCLCTYTVQRTSLHRYSLDSSYPSISAACTQAVGDINNICCPRRGCTSWSYQLIAIKQQTSCTSLPLWIDMTRRTDRHPDVTSLSLRGIFFWSIAVSVHSVLKRLPSSTRRKVQWSQI